MDNDETKSREDEALPPSDHDEPSRDTAADDAVKAASKDGGRSNTLIFPKANPTPLRLDDSFGTPGPTSLRLDDSFGTPGPTSLRLDDSFGTPGPTPLRLDDSFGMPDLSFFGEPTMRQDEPPATPTLTVPGRKPEPETEPLTVAAVFSEPDQEAEPLTVAAVLSDPEPEPDLVADAPLPRDDDTAWESLSTIGKPDTLRARIDLQEDDDISVAQAFANDDDMSAEVEEVTPEPLREANVTPFPGTLIQRQAEPAPADMLRGTATSADIFDEISDRAGEEPSSVPAELPANQDTLADAVQSALRNIYGGYSDPQDDRGDLGGYTVADALAGPADMAEEEPTWGEAGDERPDWRARRDMDSDPDPDPADDDGDSEGVLDYLYNQRRQDRASVQSGAEMSLSDYAARAASLGDDKWEQDADPDPDERVTPFSRDRLRGPDLSPEPSIIRGSGGGGSGPSTYFHDDIRPSLEPEWGQQRAFNAPQNARGQVQPTYTPAVTSQSEPTMPTQGPDSGHLLGAAGLGLIGGIALAGVLAVFVFNSFVDESGQSVSDSAPKVAERLAVPQTTASSVETRIAPQERERERPAPEPQRQVERQVDITPPAQTDAVPPPVQLPPQPQRQAALEPAPTPAPPPPQPEADGKPRLVAATANGAPETPIKLAITLSNGDVGDALVSLKGLPKEAKLSTGIDVGGGQWLLPPARLKELTVTAPGSAVGKYDLEAQLLKDDAQTSISEAVPFTLNISTAARAVPPASQQAAPAVVQGQSKQDASRLALLPDEAPLPETDFLTQMLIRDGNKKMREGDIMGARRLYEQAAQSGNAEAALAMGRSFDPTYFEKLSVKSGKPDPAMAFDWYKRALDGGLVTAKVKIDTLRQWLQR